MSENNKEKGSHLCVVVNNDKSEVFPLPPDIKLSGESWMLYTAIMHGVTEKIKEEIGSLENRMDEKIGSLENRMGEKMGSLENRMGEKIGSLENRMGEKIGSLDEKITGVDNRIGSLEESTNTKFDNLRSDMNKGFATILELMAEGNENQTQNLIDSHNLTVVEVFNALDSDKKVKPEAYRSAKEKTKGISGETLQNRSDEYTKKIKKMATAIRKKK
ncbi:hypothetical protein HON22_03130 [Candidatus Peregrinibacteria bacterium]|mgnify:CR=1 FL=1|nr:hypothetical protein [Candidatus Peregrinibacteria bacterium]